MMAVSGDDLPLIVGLVALPADPGRADPGRTGAAVRSAAGHRLAKALLARAAGRQGWQIGRAPDGRPVPRHDASDNSGDEGLALSIAHSGRVVAAAVSACGPVGVDVEIQRPRPNYRDLAAYAFGAAERDRVALDGLAGFYRIWTLREAIAKTTGEGVGLVIDRIDRVAQAPASGFWLTADRRWHLASLEPCAGLSMALAVACRRPIAASNWRPRALGWLDPDAGYCPLQSPMPSFT